MKDILNKIKERINKDKEIIIVVKCRERYGMSCMTMNISKCIEKGFKK